MTRTESSHVASNLSEMDNNFLRAARAGDLKEAIALLEAGVHINVCNTIGLTALHLASKEGFIPVVRELLKRGADFDATTKKGNTALHIGSLAGHFEVVQMLLEAGANVNRQSVIGFTPLYMASQENYLDVVDLLLKRGANQALATESGFTPLAVALQQGHERIVALLLERDSRGRGGMPALHIAARKDDVNAVNLLLNSPEANVNHQAQHGFTPLHIAAHYGNVNVARPLLERGAGVNYQAKNNITPLHIAAKWGRGEMVQLLLGAGALIDCRTRDGLTPLHCAARSGHASLVSSLIDGGANPSAKTRNGLTPLHMGAQGNNEAVVKMLIKRGASVEDKTGDLLTPLHVAAHCGNHEVARILLENRCDANARALNGFTPLHIACKKRKHAVAELLLQFGAHVDMITESGLSPLHVSAFIGSPEIVELLLQFGAPVDRATMRCETALHLAARNRQLAVARALLAHGATVDAKAKDDQTPLHMSVLTGQMELITLLLSSGANPNLTTRDAYTTMHIAAKEGHQEVIALLLSSNADPSARTKKGFTPLHLAAKRGRAKVAQQLIHTHPKSVHATGQNDLTPLHVATHYNHLRVAELLLDNGAGADCRAGNGYTPLHIAAKQNHLDIATLLLAHESDHVQYGSAKSRSGFTPLHLAAQEGHMDMVCLLLQHNADANYQSKNGLAPLHLAAQENHIPVAQVLLSSGADVCPLTRARYSPLHTACHFGHVEMVRYLLEVTSALHINQPTQMGFTPLHLAAQQGHSHVVQVLISMGADGNMRNQQGLTPAHIARRQHFVTIFDILKTVTTTVVSWEEEEEEIEGALQLEQPDYMKEHPLSESDDDEAGPSPATPRRVPRGKPKTDESLASGGSIGDQRSRTGTFSMGFDTAFSTGENDDIWGQLEYMRSTLTPGGTLAKETAEEAIGAGMDDHPHDIISPLSTSMVDSPPEVKMDRAQLDNQAMPTGADWEFEAENVSVVRKPVTAGFLVSFIVDARGGMIQAQRCPDLRFLIPPSVIDGPLRIVCRLLHPERVNQPPPLNDGDGFACRLLELGPAGTRFTAPIVMEIPHYAFLTEKNREVIVLRSDNGEAWKEHILDASDQAVYDTVNGYFDRVSTAEELKERSVFRILTYDLPQYFALITRVRQEPILIGPEGGTLSSTVAPDVQVEFPPGALQKRIRVGLQVHSVDQELVSRLMGPRVAVSPVVTIEPRRRKFHKPIVLKMPLPRNDLLVSGESTSVVNSPSLRLLCSISGGTSPTVWEDITGSSPLTANKNVVSFTSTVSARLWLVDCPNITDVVQLASRVHHESLAVPYLGRFIVYGRRHQPEEAQLRCLCLTDDPVNKTLEHQEGFQLIATGPQVEVLDDHPHWIETAGNLVPVAKTEEQLQLGVQAFHENRLNMLVRVKDLSQPAIGKLAFVRHPRAVVQTMNTAQVRVTVLEARLPDILGSATDGAVEPKTTDIDAVRYGDGMVHAERPDDQVVDGYVVLPRDGTVHAEAIARSELDLHEVATCVSSDWPALADHLGVSEENQAMIRTSYSSDSDRAYATLLLWHEQEASDYSTGTRLAQVLQQIGRADVFKTCMVNVTEVTSPEEIQVALRTLDAADHDGRHSGLLSDTSGLGVSVDATTTGPEDVQATVTNDSNGFNEIITPVNISRSMPAGTVESEPVNRPRLNPEQRETALLDVKRMMLDSEEEEERDQPLQPKSPVSGEPGVDELIIVPELVEREIPVSVQHIEPFLHEGIDENEDIVDEFPLDEEDIIKPTVCQPCGLNEATWGPSPHTCETIEPNIEAPAIQREYEPCGNRESTWGTAPDDRNPRRARGPNPSGYDINYEFVSPTPLTPIPEKTEISSLITNPAASWDSTDISPSSSLESTALARRKLHQLLLRLKAAAEASVDSNAPFLPERDITDDQNPPGFSGEPDQFGTDGARSVSRTRTSSTRSSMHDFLRMETSCDGSRADLLTDEDRQLLMGQSVPSFSDLVSSLQTIQRQHLNDPARATLVSGESSSGSPSAIGSGEGERLVGTELLEMLRLAESDAASLPLVASMVTAQLQQLIQSVSFSSSNSSGSHARSSNGAAASGVD